MFFLIKDFPFKGNICFSLSRILLSINDLEIRKFRDKYLLCVFSNNKFPICGEMAGWGDSGSQTGSRTASSGGFLCGFNIVGRLRQLHEAGQAVGLRGCRAY